MKNWIILQNKIIDREKIIALDYQNETLKVYLDGNSIIELSGKEAKTVWSEINPTLENDVQSEFVSGGKIQF